jgi:energy-coupling factor transporter ATP-binding protein EcfA2
LKFGIEAITVWSKKDEQRQLKFKRNKVNVLTGESHTGKSTLLDIIDYCLLASSHKIADSIINENVAWYGITFYISGKLFTIARRSPVGAKVSDDFYFSSTGLLPQLPVANTSINDLKKILEAEFRIDDAVTLAYGGQTLKAGSKVSFRYFFLFSTISEDIITSRDVYFDKQTEDRYKEALPRIFDLALGIDTLDNIAAREKKDSLRKQISKLEKKTSSLDGGRVLFDEELRGLAAQAAAYGLPKIDTENLSPLALAALLRDASGPTNDDALHTHSQLSAKIFDLERRLRKLRSFSSEFSAYRNTLKSTQDSLLPLEQIIKQSPEIVKSEIFDELISHVKSDLNEIKQSIKGKLPVDGQIAQVASKLQAERLDLIAQLQALPKEPQSFQGEKEKWLFVGETLGRLNTYYSPQTRTESEDDIEKLRGEMDAIKVIDVAEKKDAVLSVINEVALGLLKSTGNVLANYSSYVPEFVYKDKRLRLRKPRSSDVENIGSSSNHMFLHLFHFLSLQEVSIGQASPFIPNFLIIDQPSRPYYPDNKPKDGVLLNNSDTAKVHTAFKLLDDFISGINKHYDQEFQMIVLEHVPVTIFEKMENINILPEFRDGEALIPASWK